MDLSTLSQGLKTSPSRLLWPIGRLQYHYWASYQIGDLLLGAELAEKDNLVGDDMDGFLIMGNYALTDAAALTLRYLSKGL